jgi:hypothetical protein
MGSGCRVISIILKIFCCFFEFFRFLICQVLFFVERFSTLGKEPFAEYFFAECKMVFAE